MTPAHALKSRALELGFDLAGVAPPSALHDLEFLPQWLRKGYGGEMHYLSDPRREDPHRALPSVKSVVCVSKTRCSFSDTCRELRWRVTTAMPIYSC